MGDNYNEALLIDRVMELEDRIKEKESEIQNYEILLGYIEESVNGYYNYGVSAEKTLMEIQNAITNMKS